MFSALLVGTLPAAVIKKIVFLLSKATFQQIELNDLIDFPWQSLNPVVS